MERNLAKATSEDMIKDGPLTLNELLIEETICTACPLLQLRALIGT